MKARNLEGQYAGFLSRAVGLFLDYAIVLVILVIFALLAFVLFNAVGVNLLTCGAGASTPSFASATCTGGRAFTVMVLALTTPGYFVLPWTLVGQTVGQRVMGVRVTRPDGRKIGIGRGILRLLGYQLCFLTFGIGFLWVLVDDQRRGWHDLIARTCVVYSWKAVQSEEAIERINQFFHRKGAGQAGPPKTAS